MANELTVSASVKFKSGTIEVQFAKSGLTFDVSGSKYTHLIQEIGTSEEALDLGDIGTVGFIILFNRDDTNFVELRAGTGLADLVRIEAGEPAMFRLAQDATPYAIADTAAVDLEYLLIAD